MSDGAYKAGDSEPGEIVVKTSGDADVGDEMQDGTILAGYFGGRALYVTPRDAPGAYSFNEAAKYAKNLNAHCHRDFRAPSKGELNVLWGNRNKGRLAGTFNESGSNSAGWYWSSSRSGIFNGWAQRFSHGFQNHGGRNSVLSLRCVRG